MQCSGRDQNHAGTQSREGEDVGTGHPRVADVAHDGHTEPVETAESLPERETVEHCLGGMLVGAVAGVDDGTLHPFIDPHRGAGSLVPDHHEVCPEGFDGLRRVLEALALREGGTPCGEAHDVG